MRMPDRAHRPDDRGFTLVELLVVILVIGILSGIAVPVYLNQQQRAREAAVLSEVRTLGQEVQMWLTDGMSASELAIGLDEDESGRYWFLWKWKQPASATSSWWGTVTRLSRASDDLVPVLPDGSSMTSPMNVDDGTGTLITLEPLAITQPVGVRDDGSYTSGSVDNWCLAVTLDPDGDSRTVRYSSWSGLEWDKLCNVR